MAFPSPAENYHDASLDLNALLVQNPSATFFVRNESDAIDDIRVGDILVIDRSLSPLDNAIVLAVIEGVFVLRRLSFHQNKWRLQSDKNDTKSIALETQSDFEIWGIVKHCIHSF
jgi:DNA polymerase V